MPSPVDPMGPTIKICGLTEEGGLEAALAAGVAMVGFVFCEASPRNVPLARARALAECCGDRALRVALTVDADDRTIDAVVSVANPHWLQLHGAESPARIVALRERFGLPVMRAIAVRSAETLAEAAAFDTVCDGILFDAAAPLGADRTGGHGTRFDWSLLRGVSLRCPWMLAGGLHAGNVAEALATTGARGVDVSSGVESAPGHKDPARIAAFVAAARGRRQMDDRAAFG